MTPKRRPPLLSGCWEMVLETTAPFWNCRLYWSDLTLAEFVEQENERILKGNQLR